MNINKKLMFLVKISLFMFTFLLISACSQSEKYETIEVYAIETFDDNQNDKGLYEQTGYKIVNAMTTIKEGETYINSEIVSIEDFYDMEGNYIQTNIIHTNSNKSYLLHTEEGNTHKETIHEPSTILITPDNVKNNFKLIKITQEEKALVKEHLLAFMEKL